MQKLKWLLPLALFVPLLMAPSGGYPTQPTFQNVTVTPTAGVALTLTGSAANQIGILNGIGSNTWFDLNRSAVLIGRFGSADATVVGGATTDFGFSAPGGGLNFATGGSSASRMTISSTGAIAFVGNAQQPVVAFDANLVVSPTIGTCLHCQVSPTVVRNSIGNYTITPQSTGNYLWSCTYRNNSTAPGTIAIGSLTTGGLTVQTYTSGNSLGDNGTVECVGVS